MGAHSLQVQTVVAELATSHPAVQWMVWLVHYISGTELQCDQAKRGGAKNPHVSRSPLSRGIATAQHAKRFVESSLSYRPKIGKNEFDSKETLGSFFCKETQK